jgi:hypothetical protein
VSRRIPASFLLLAWLCASGAMLDVAQVVAWGRMFAGYARNNSVVSAAQQTFDPSKPCAICRAVSRAREASGPRSPAVASAGSEKRVLILEAATPFVAVAAERDWPRVTSCAADVRCGDVPVPPPRAVAA